jgi:hypothetical protein
VAYNATNPVTVGSTLKKSQYDRVFDNIIALQSALKELSYLRLKEGGAPTPAAGETTLYGSSSDHALRVSQNGGSFAKVLTDAMALSKLRLTDTSAPTAAAGEATLYATSAALKLALNGGSFADILTAATAGVSRQILSTVYTTQHSTATSTFGDTGLSLSITLKSASNRVLVLVFQTARVQNSGDHMEVQLVGPSLTRVFGKDIGGATDTNQRLLSWAEVSAPGSVGPHTYKTQFRRSAGTNDAVLTQPSSAPSSLVLVEFAG